MAMTVGVAQRVSDAEREVVVDRLKDAYADGTLERDEFDSRLQLALTARTGLELAGAARGLERPAPHAGLAPPTVDERVLAAVAQASSLVPIVVPPAFILATTRSPYVRHHAAGALNLQITLLLLTIVTLGLGAVLYGFVWIVALVAAMVALTGTPLHYPFVLRMFGRGGPYPV